MSATEYQYDPRLEAVAATFQPVNWHDGQTRGPEQPGHLLVDVYMEGALRVLSGDGRGRRWVARAGSPCVILGRWSDGTVRARVRISLEDRSLGATSREFVGRFPDWVVESLDAPVKGQVLRGNAEAFAAAAPAGKPWWRFW